MDCSFARGRLIRRRQGATLVEFVVIISLIIVAALLTFSVLGEQVRTSLSRLGDPVHPHSAHSSSSGTQSLGRSERPQASSSVESASEPDDEDRRLQYQRWLAVATCLASLGVLVMVRRKPKHISTGSQTLPRADELIDKRQKLLLVLQKHLQHVNNTELSVRQLMSSQLVTVRPTAKVEKVRHFMESERVRHVLVCQGQSRLIGVISDRDISQRSGGTASQIMTPNPISVRPDTPLIAAATTILNRGISCLPVVEGERLCGVLTTTDLVLGLQATLQLLEKLACQPDWSGTAAG